MTPQQKTRIKRKKYLDLGWIIYKKFAFIDKKSRVRDLVKKLVKARKRGERFVFYKGFPRRIINQYKPQIIHNETITTSKEQHSPNQELER